MAYNIIRQGPNDTIKEILVPLVDREHVLFWYVISTCFRVFVDRRRWQGDRKVSEGGNGRRHLRGFVSREGEMRSPDDAPYISMAGEGAPHSTCRQAKGTIDRHSMLKPLVLVHAFSVIFA